MNKARTTACSCALKRIKPGSDQRFRFDYALVTTGCTSYQIVVMIMGAIIAPFK